MLGDLLLAEEKITQHTVELLLSWRHSGFSVFAGDVVEPDDRAGLERLAAYILHAPFSQARIAYNRQARTVTCYRRKVKPGQAPAVIRPALDWLADLTLHIPERGQQLVRYYGRYANVCQARPEQARAQDPPPESRRESEAENENDDFRKERRRNWARLIKKVYGSDPLVCPKCSAPMRIISFIEDPVLVRKILVHLKLWDTPERSPPRSPTPPDIVYDPDFFAGLTS